MRINKALLVAALGAGIAVVAVTEFALAQQAPAAPPPVNYRQGVMRTQAANIGGIMANLKGEVQAKQNIAHHAEILNCTAIMLPTLWPKGSEGGKTKPEIWTDWAKAEGIIKEFQAATAKLVQAAASGDQAAIQAAAGDVGKGCGACHTPYRAQ